MKNLESVKLNQTHLSPKNDALIRQSTYTLQNKLVEKQRESSQGSYQSLLFRLSQPSAEIFQKQPEAFLREDFYISPKYRNPHKKDRETMDIRFEDG